jgi:hypothetical protein
MEGLGDPPTASFGIFDHLDHAGGSLRHKIQFSGVRQIAALTSA